MQSLALWYPIDFQQRVRNVGVSAYEVEGVSDRLIGRRESCLTPEAVLNDVYRSLISMFSTYGFRNFTRVFT